MKKIVLGLLCFAMLIGQCKADESVVISMDERKLLDEIARAYQQILGEKRTRERITRFL